MNYYEELGIRPDADEEEIRKAHRRLVKIMHPDQHRDQGLKQLAETQMRRLNSIVATLLDPEERREYDEQLRGGEMLSQTPQQSSWRSVPWWIASTLGAIVLTVAAVWFFADRLGSSINPKSHPPIDISGGPEKPSPANSETGAEPNHPAPVSQPQPAAGGENTDPEKTVVKVPAPERKLEPVKAAETPKEASSSKQATFPPSQTTPASKVAIDRQARPEPPKVQTGQLTHAPNTTTDAVTTANSPQQPLAQQKKIIGNVPVRMAQPTLRTSLDGLRAPTGLASANAIDGDLDIPRPRENPPPPPPSTFPPMGHRDPLEGEWVYAPTEPEKPKPGLFPPEFIQLKLTKDTTGMRGEYSARYNVVDNKIAISPNVNFVLKAVDDKAMKYVWTAADGRHGTLTIRQLEADTMRLEWRDTSARKTPAFTQGMATLVRRN